MKNLYELMMTKKQDTVEEDNAMFTTKPLSKVSCASCSKYIVNSHTLTNPAEFNPWSKLPYKENAERLSKV